MTNIEKYNHAFIDVFAVSEIEEQLDTNTLAKWDSIHQLNLISVIEETFDIMLDTEDILEFTSYVKGKEILRLKYSINFEE
jgi:acyl carrier protein